MARRKGAGGYAVSSEDSSDDKVEEPPVKKQHLPPMITRPSQPKAAPTFNLPAPAKHNVAWSSARTQPKPFTPLLNQPQKNHHVSIPTPSTPTNTKCPIDDDGGNSNSSDSPAGQFKRGKNTIAAGPSTGAGAYAEKSGMSEGHRRSRFALEGRVDGMEESLRQMKESVAKRLCVVDDQIRVAEERQDKRHDEIKALLIGLGSRPAMVENNVQLAPPATQPGSIIPLSNLPVPAGLRDRVLRTISADAVNARSGKDNKDNAKNKHVRVSWYQMLQIKGSSEIRPFYLYDDGSFDLFPKFLCDEETGYGVPCPNWKSTLADQMAWIPTYLHFFRAMIIRDDSQASNDLLAMSDEEAIARLNDGPFKTAKSVWSKMEQGEARVAELRKLGREKGWIERKATTRLKYRSKAGLDAPEHDYLFNKGFMSRETSDGEGGRVVYQPDYRSLFINNLFAAMRNAQWSVIIKAHPNTCFPRRTYKIANSIDIPELKYDPKISSKASGNDGSPRIPLYALGKNWCKTHQHVVKSVGSAVNHSLKIPPNIDQFLSDHPNIDPDDADDEWEGSDDGFDGRSNGPEYNKGLEGDRGDILECRVGEGEALVRSGDMLAEREDSVEREEFIKKKKLVGMGKVFNKDEAIEDGNKILLDPALHGLQVQVPIVVTPWFCQPAKPTSVDTAPQQADATTIVDQGVPPVIPPSNPGAPYLPEYCPPSQHPIMPPPPLPPAPESGPLTGPEQGAPPLKKRGRPAGSKNKPKTDQALREKKKRGRPAGSKNKPRAEEATD